MKAIEIRNKYLNFFKKHGHKIIPSAPLIQKMIHLYYLQQQECNPLVPIY